MQFDCVDFNAVHSTPLVSSFQDGSAVLALRCMALPDAAVSKPITCSVDVCAWSIEHILVQSKAKPSETYA